MAGSLPYAHVPGPPEAPPSPYGLFTAATMLEDLRAPATAGIQYEVDCSTDLIVWPGPCPIPTGEVLTRSVTVRLEGRRTESGYTVTAFASEESGAVVELAVTVVSGTFTETAMVVTGTNGTAIYSGTEPASGTIQVVAGGTDTGQLPLTQSLDDGSIINGYIPVITFDVTVEVDPAPPKSHPPSRHTVTADAFTLVAVEECSLVGYSMTELQGFASRNLRENEQRWVERVVWEGAYGNSPSLTGCEPELPAGDTAVDVITAVSLAEEWYGRNLNGRGVLHGSNALAALAKSNELTDRYGVKYTTPLGHSWAFGDGYQRTGPPGSTTGDNEAWMFVTGPVTIRRTAIRGSAGMQYRQNKPVITSERIYVVDWACGCAAIKVDLSKTGGCCPS